jgi:hypothetical protein
MAELKELAKIIERIEREGCWTLHPSLGTA